MAEPPAQWDINLDRPPAVRQLSIGVHGTVPVERHRLGELWSLHLYDYFGDLWMDGRHVPIRPGAVTLTPPQVTLELHYRGRSVHLYAHFAASGSLPASLFPAIQYLDHEAEKLRPAMQEAVGWWSATPHRAEARLWDLLWQLSQRNRAPSPSHTPHHPLFARATELIELRLPTPIEVRALADELRVSHNHLNRIFRAAAGMTVGRYIRQRRLNRAHHLLTQTDMSVKLVACEVGIPDLHSFNKLVRRAFGCPPRQVHGPPRP